MTARMMLSFSLALILVPCGLHAQETPGETVAKAKLAVEKQVEEWKGADFKAEAIDEKYVRETFPNHVFVAVHFREWPIARPTPEPLKYRNVFAVGKDGKATHLADAKKLEEFFRSTLKTQLHQDKTTRTWLRLRMEYIQDGYYKFKYPEKAKDGPAASSVTIVYGVVEVVPEAGNKGTFTATLRFNQGGQLASLSEENKVIRGMRPRVLGD
ncbi:MAG: hypothetical protein HYR84_14925 [Planctomycetes bacterium]|nr:hypothetical protein [Planctomycetota bacterium]